MSQRDQRDDTLHLAQEFLGRMGSGAEPAAIAKLFSENIVRFQMLEKQLAVSQAARA